MMTSGRGGGLPMMGTAPGRGGGIAMMGASSGRGGGRIPIMGGEGRGRGARISMMAREATEEYIRNDHSNRDSNIRPGPLDVVCGRGRGSFSSSGNRILLKLFQDNKDRYLASTKAEKAVIARKIVSEIQKPGGRFLKRTEDGNWFVVHDSQAYRKVCHG